MAKRYLLQVVCALLTLFTIAPTHCMHKREQNNRRLGIAAQNGDLDTVRFFLAPRAFVNALISITDNKGNKKQTTPLCQATQENHTTVMRFLLANKADSNLARPTESITPLLLATFHEGSEAVELLLHAKADPNKLSSLGFSPLMNSSELGNIEAIQKLLAANADVNLQSYESGDGVTALHQAAQNGHVQAVQLLIHAKADINKTRLDRGGTPLHVAVIFNKSPVVQCLVDAGAKTDVLDAQGKRPIDYATTEDIKKILSKGSADEGKQ